MDLDEDTHLALAYEGGVARLTDVGGVLTELKSRVGELGVVSDSAEPYVINDIGRKHDVHIDFYSVPPGKLNGLERAKKGDHPPETRYVFLGASKRDEVVAEKQGWEHHDFEEVAEDEGWELDAERERG
ncbi:MAG: hypothetical protein SV760_03230 [Halobacteria archaeon]|nr:hypothetical protein [Halobacteria archaeon]